MSTPWHKPIQLASAAAFQAFLSVNLLSTHSNSVSLYTGSSGLHCAPSLFYQQTRLGHLSQHTH